MNTEVHPAIAAAVITMAVLAAVLWAWGSGSASSYGGPAELSTGPGGHHYIQVQNYLIEHDELGRYVRTHDLDELGVELVLGGHAFFSNGDILLRLGPDPRSFMDNFRAYKRETNLSSIAPEAAGSGLFRCNLESLDCEQFGEEGIDFKAAFGVFIDWSSDEVFISDTTRHLLRKYDASGVEQVTPADGFRFPNQLMVHDGLLLVADTNHHVIRSLDVDTLEKTADRINVVPEAARIQRQTWPGHFARVGNEWWVNNMKSGMDLGGLYVFDDDWQYLRRIELPPDADPISLLPVGDEVWVSDWNNDVVRRFSAEGVPLPDLESEGLAAVLADSAVKRRFYTVVSYGGVVLVAFMLLALVFRSVVFGSKPGEGQRPVTHTAGEVDDASGLLHLEPDEKLRKQMTSRLYLVAILTVLTVAPLVFIFNAFEQPESIFKLTIPIAGLVAIVGVVVWVNRGNWGTFIKADADTVTLRDFTGRESRCPVRKVRYDDTAIATPDAVVMLGRPQAQIYDRAEVQDVLFPRLDGAQRVGALEMLMIQIRLRHPQGLVTVIALIALLLYGVIHLAW